MNTILKSYGYNREVFEGLNTIFSNNYIAEHNKRMKEVVINNKLGIAYNITLRYKSNEKISDSNSEVIHFKFDPNLSVNGYRSYQNFETGESLSCQLLTAEQSRYGNTKLVYSTQYINKEQELFENNDCAYCDSVKGRIERKLEKYIETFINEFELQKNKYLNKCFELHFNHVIKNFASHIYINRKDAYGSHAIKADINKILTIFSIRNNDCFNAINEREFDLWSHPFYDNENFSSLKMILLNIDQVEEIDRCIDIFKDIKFKDSFKDSANRYGRIDYLKLKEILLN